MPFVLAALGTVAHLIALVGSSCSRYSGNRYSDECEARGQAALGVFVILVAIGVIVVFCSWQYLKRRTSRSPTEDDAPRV